MMTDFWLSIPFPYLLRRGLAYLADCTLVFIIFAVSQSLILTPIRNLFDTSWMMSGPRLELYVLLTISLPTWLYFALTECSTWQASLGKRLLGLRVVDATAAQRVTFGQALLRTVIKLLPWEAAHLTVNLPRPLYFFPPEPGELRGGFWLVAILMLSYGVAMLLPPRNRGLHDLVARTVVVR